ncbi:photosynthetic protein synthase I [Vibrio sp. 10N.286.49.B3]|uniref:SCO family protein n=1 Tax=Vibrio sp. 10N.286.49.B3 TaxID=1880855 RepID=UPI000C849DDE|nr:SCO family protein [Vibrio sp. 10N.286.49.B3]PMH43130.1 photosynthetic protein synthase I [Vibrio sp. 10N.286.49.B3]
MKRRWILVLAVAFGLGFVLQSYMAPNPPADTQQQATINLSSGKTDSDLTLFDTNDSRIRVVYFGFTRCPDVCPTSLAMLTGALNQISDEDKQHLWPIFISIDPARDSASDTHTYAQYFHPMIEGASGDLATISMLAKRYGVIFQNKELADSQLGYTVDHNSYFYFLKPNGELISKVPHTLNPSPIIHEISTILSAEGMQ